MIALVAGVISGSGVGRVDVERDRIDVDEDRLGAQPPDRAGRGEERVAGQQHFVARADVDGHQRQQQSVAARGAADGELGLAIRGERVSSVSHSGPRTNRPESQTRAIAASNSSLSGWYCRCTSNSGTGDMGTPDTGGTTTGRGETWADCVLGWLMASQLTGVKQGAHRAGRRPQMRPRTVEKSPIPVKVGLGRK